MASLSPTQRTLADCRKKGLTAAVVERYSAFDRRRHDLFGFIDVLAVGDGVTYAIQTTSGSNFSARRKKIVEHENYEAVKAAGWVILVHGWRKNSKGRWVLREEAV